MISFLIKLIYTLKYPYSVYVFDYDAKKHRLHMAKNMKDAIEWGRCYFTTDVVSIYKQSLFSGLRLVATEKDI